MAGLERLKQCGSRAEALRVFLGLLEENGERIGRSRKKVADIYSFVTPEAPYYEVALNDCPYEASHWALSEDETRLDRAVQGIAWQLTAAPATDYIPAVTVGALDSGLIARVLGSDVRATPDGGAVVERYALKGADSDVAALLEIDPLQNAEVREILRQTAYWADCFGGAVDIVYPQMQGSFSNIVRLMPQEEALVASLAEPEKIRRLALHIAGMIARIIRAFRAAGEGGSLRARLRLPPPPGVKGLFVDDYVSVLRPADFLSLNIDAYRLMADAFGGTFLHTCGPVSQCTGILPELPGIVGFETCFVEKQHKTTAQLEKLKAGMYNRIVVGSFALPFGQPVEDMENLTDEWLKKMSRGGGFMMQSSGTVGEAAEIAEKLKL